MADIKDVGAYLLQRRGKPMTAMQLEKLAYYSQAWHLAWEGTALTESSFEGWKDGPVSRDLYITHRKAYVVSAVVGGEPSRLTSGERAIIDAVLDFYGGMTPEQLSERTHREEPWLESRVGLPDGAYGDREISVSTMSRCYTRQVIEAWDTPRRPRISEAPVDVDSTLAEAERQMARWSHTLAWLADR